nr:MAG TPA_asm: hypothetical protein [Bacteriophage sp.]DAT27319.1 MAG TPA: hypothetical protein [Caudoviricetes sp.]
MLALSAIATLYCSVPLLIPLRRYCYSICLLFTREEIRSTLDCKSFQYYSPKRGLSRFKSASLSYCISVVS